ncbi:hypothetical protein ACJIZ3_011730 [Penstemon smallii]|uniref:Peptidase A1 domain-containing protein n=1 Tax=Penstemon smallii TaxID=265156 RepID=A0ABD3UMU3_9LAMI
MSVKLALYFIFLVSLLFGHGSSFPAFLAPITKDFSKERYTLSIYLKTPSQPTNLLLDLGGSFTLVDCSTTYHSVPCGSSVCGSTGSSCKVCTGSPVPDCFNDSCTNFLGKSVTRKLITVEARVGSLYLHTTNGRNPGAFSVIPKFMFSCTNRSLLKGRVKGLAGLAGFGRSGLSLPAQVSNVSSNDLIFALCLSGSPSAPGVAFFGTSGPYYFFPEIDLSKHLIYTPLLFNQVGIGSTTISYANPSNEYFIGLTTIKVNGKVIDFDRTLLDIGKNGFGGTKLSTITPYTMLHTSIYKALIETFMKESLALNLTRTTSAKQFNVCYNADDVLSTRVGPTVPTVDFVLQDDSVIWRILGSNSMVRVYKDNIDVWCLGFLDGGSKPRASIVIGGHQMEDNLLQFDLKSKRLGFSSSILVHDTMCANFNFTI